MMHALDRRFLAFCFTLWKPSRFIDDREIFSATITARGKILGYADQVQPEGEIEKWMTLGLNLCRERCNPADMVPLIAISSESKLPLMLYPETLGAEVKITPGSTL